MPISGTLDISPRVARLPLATDLATEPVVLPRAEVLYVLFEIDSQDVEGMLPPALHPTDPRIATFVAIRSSESPFGAFTLTQTRIGCRAGVRPRGFVTGGYIDDLGPAGTLAERWGFSLDRADVVLERRYHDIVAEVNVDGRLVLCASLVDPLPLSGAEIQFAASMQLARVVRDGAEVPRLVQVDPDLTYHRAARGEARLDAFEPAAWGDERITPVYPVSAWYALCDLTLPRVRYICDPDIPALQGTEKLG